MAGSLLYGVAVRVFALPSGLIAGGATGIAIVVNHLISLPVGLGIVLVNLPLFAVSIRRLGGSFLVKTILATFLSAAAVDLLSFLPVYTGDRLMACLFGGILSGCGLGIIYLRGITTGGSDLLTQLIRTKKPQWDMGRLIFLIDAVIVGAGTLVVDRNLTTALYSAIYIFSGSMVIDRILSRSEKGCFCLIVSARYKWIAQQILEKMHRGATLLYARGCFERSEQPVLLCAVYRYEMPVLRRLILQEDKDAFFIVSQASEIAGVGFLSYQ